MQVKMAHSTDTAATPNNFAENSKFGFICLFRSLQRHWLWKDAEKLKWWIDILLEANHQERKVIIAGRLLQCGRGQSLNSLQTWAERWSVDVGKVRRFLKMLETDGMIVVENLKKTTRITICNYVAYNGKRHDNDTMINLQRTSNELQTNTNNNGNNANKDNNGNNSNSMSLNISFEEFWNLYDKKCGSKEKLEAKWGKLKDEERTAIMEYIPRYKQHQPDKQYRKNPDTFFDQRGWEHEIVGEVKQKQYKTFLTPEDNKW